MAEIESQVVIVAPHPDDEIIGCFSILEHFNKCHIIYTSSVENSRKEEALKLKSFYSVRQFFLDDMPPALKDKRNIFFYPDPSSEVHPDHKFIGIEGEKLARSGFDVNFYSIQMNVPYIHKIKNYEKKEKVLNEVYHSQKSLWEYEKKYILFEGYCKWLF